MLLPSDTNKTVSSSDRKGVCIAHYLEDEENFVLNSVVLYAKPQEARFKPDAGFEGSPVRPGTLFLNYGARSSTSATGSTGSRPTRT